MPSQFLPLCLVLLSLTFMGCGGAGEADRPSGLDDVGMGGAGGTDVADGPCQEGAGKTCKITIEQANGQKSCFTGAQYCEEGQWSPCYEPEYDPHLQ